MIEYVHIDGHRAKLANQKFPRYFSVDSIAVLIGANGSGKTRLLINVAEALTAGTQIGGQGHWRGWDQHGQPTGDDTRNPPPGQGVVYYTPLPYRRAISPHRHFFDASGFGGHLSRSRSYRQYRFVTERLEVEARLMARMSYRNDVFQRLIVPRMLEPDCQLIDPVMDARRLELVKGQTLSLGDISYTADLGSFANSIESWILHLLENSEHEPVVLLATLEHSAKTLKQRPHAIRAFLEFIGIATFNPIRDQDSSQAFQKLEGFRKLVSTTASFYRASLSKGLNPIASREQIGYEMELDYEGAPRRLGSSVGAFEIGWENLSSGLLSLVEQFTRLELGLERLRKRGLTSVLVLIDEGDAYLHMDWQRQYVLHLNAFLERIKRDLRYDSLQVLLATHSPIISGDFPSPMVQLLGQDRHHEFKTFGSSLDALVLDTFGTASIGEFAARKIKELRKNFVEGKLEPSDYALIDEIGDEGLRRAILSSMEGE
ncbi:hypothetical protein OPV09_07060 [Janthinobacterium sp. TB1-E2]|uniref:AAA+ ATPase domain-containing protein n=1 Tax=Janthinobacterium aestuarii TaxID=2985511 RepID=A0ABZ2GR66_9BURK